MKWPNRYTLEVYSFPLVAVWISVDGELYLGAWALDQQQKGDHLLYPL